MTSQSSSNGVNQATQPDLKDALYEQLDMTAEQDSSDDVHGECGLPQDGLDEAEAPPLCPVNLPAPTCDSNDGQNRNPFGDSAEDIAAKETRFKVELFAWADSVLGLGKAELELALAAAVKRFQQTRAVLMRIVEFRREEKKKESDRTRGQSEEDRPEDNLRFYSDDFKVLNRGVFARDVDNEGNTVWRPISTTRIDLLALTRDTRGENWGTYVLIVNRDGEEKRIAIPHALIAANRATDIPALLASLGVGVVAAIKDARQKLLEFLMLDLKERITAVPQIGWHRSGSTWVFVLPDETIVPAGFEGARPVLQTSSLQLQHGLDVSGTVEEWIDEVAAPLAGNSNVYLCVGVMFAGPLLKWANEPPGLFHLPGASKIGKSLIGAVAQSVWGRPKVPGEADAFGASWTATAVGLERYAILRSDVGAYFDEIGEGSPQTIRPAIYMLANGSSKLRGTRELSLQQMESFRILGISTGEPTIADYLSNGGEKVPAGLSVRLVDVPAEVQPESAFETCSVQGIEELGHRFYPLTTQLHGAVGRRWLQHLVDLGADEITARIQKHRDAWLAQPIVAAVRAQGTGQVRSVLNRFALVAAALRMAIEEGLVPWNVDDTDLGIAACMTRWAKARKGRLDLSGEKLSAVEQIRAVLAANLHGRFIHLKINGDGKLEYDNPYEGDKRDTLGYVKDGRILIEPTAWRTVLCNGYDPEKTAQHLRKEGLLLADEGKLQKQEKILRAGSEAENGRFYVLDMQILNDPAITEEPSS